MSQAVTPEAVAALPVAESEAGLLAWVTTVDHKKLGILYFISSFTFFVIGGIEALVMRVQLAAPGLHIVSPDMFNQLFTMHGTTMIFLVVVPMLLGFMTYFVPLMIGARDMAFPRLNALSFWTQAMGGILLYFSFAAGGAPNAGWFAYTPLSEHAYSSLLGLDYWSIGLLAIGVGTLAAGVNFIVTVITLRAPGMRMTQVPLFVWMSFINSWLILLAMPIINASIVLLIADRLLQSNVFNPAGGGSAVLWQHFFWGFGHPEVYIMILPAFGIISEIVPVFSRKPIFGYEFVAGSTLAIAFLSFTVWAHHMFAVGMGPYWDAVFAACSMLIAVPTGVKIFNWVATMWGGQIRLKTAMLYAIAFLITFTIGGLTGIAFAVAPIDWQLTDTYFVVAHFHFTVFGGAAFAMFGGFYYWFPKMSGRMLSERIGRWQFWLTIVGFYTTFFFQHFLGMMGMPRRVFTYPDLPGWATLNLISTIGAFMLAAGVLLLVWNIYVSRLNGERAGDDPWDGWTLEWLTTSPPPEENFDLVPPIHGRRPLWDLKHPDRTDAILEQARG